MFLTNTLHQLSLVKETRAAGMAIFFLRAKAMSSPPWRSRREKMSDHHVMLVKMPRRTLDLGS